MRASPRIVVVVVVAAACSGSPVEPTPPCPPGAVMGGGGHCISIAEHQRVARQSCETAAARGSNVYWDDEAKACRREEG